MTGAMEPRPTYVSVGGAQCLYTKPLNTSQAAEYLGISTRHLLRLVRSGVIPAQKVGNSWRFSQEKLARVAGIIG